MIGRPRVAQFALMMAKGDDPFERQAEFAWQVAREVVRATASRSGDAASAAVARAAGQPDDVERGILIIGTFVVPLLIKGNLGPDQPSRDVLWERAQRLEIGARSVVDLQAPELLRVLSTAYGDHEPGAPMSLARFVIIGLLALGVLLDDPVSEFDRVRERALDYAIGELRTPSLEWSMRRGSRSPRGRDLDGALRSTSEG